MDKVVYGQARREGLWDAKNGEKRFVDLVYINPADQLEHCRNRSPPGVWIAIKRKSRKKERKRARERERTRKGRNGKKHGVMRPKEEVEMKAGKLFLHSWWLAEETGYRTVTSYSIKYQEKSVSCYVCTSHSQVSDRGVGCLFHGSKHADWVGALLLQQMNRDLGIEKYR